MRVLAAAAEEDVLALWSGLGYYSRARNLHRAARAVCAEHGGELPAEEEALRGLPGVGEYTAAAVASIAFGVPTFPLDGNGARVMARLFAVDEPIDRPAVRVRLRALGQALVPAARPGDYAQAVMELGALVCVAGAPRCEGCPVATACAARAAGREGELPVRSPRRPKQIVRLACAAVVRRGKVLLVRRPPRTLLAGTWTLPAAEAAADEAEEAVLRRALAETGLAPAGAAQAAGAIRHVFTHRDVTAAVFRMAADRDGAGGPRRALGGRGRAGGARAVELHAQDAGADPLSLSARRTQPGLRGGVHRGG